MLNETYTLNNGLEIPKIALGTWQMSTAQAVYPTLFALNNGYKHVDGAWGYQNARGIAARIKNSQVNREDIFLTSKIHAGSKAYNEAISNLYNLLEEYETDYIDLVIIHCPTPWRYFDFTDPKRPHYYKENLDVWRALEEYYHKGVIKAIGLSNFNVSDINNILDNCEVKPAVNQIRFAIGFTQDEIVKFCQDNDILIEAYSSLGTGKLLNHPDIQKIADKYEVSLPQICYRYPLQKGHVILSKTVHEEYILSNAQLDFEISAEDMEFLDHFEIE